MQPGLAAAETLVPPPPPDAREGLADPTLDPPDLTSVQVRLAGVDPGLDPDCGADPGLDPDRGADPNPDPDCGADPDPGPD